MIIDPEAEISEAIKEGMSVELFRVENGWVARIGQLDQVVTGRSAAEVFLNIADILAGPELPGEQ